MKLQQSLRDSSKILKNINEAGRIHAQKVLINHLEPIKKVFGDI